MHQVLLKANTLKTEMIISTFDFLSLPIIVHYCTYQAPTYVPTYLPTHSPGIGELLEKLAGLEPTGCLM